MYTIGDRQSRLMYVLLLRRSQEHQQMPWGAYPHQMAAVTCQQEQLKTKVARVRPLPLKDRTGCKPLKNSASQPS